MKQLKYLKNFESYTVKEHLLKQNLRQIQQLNQQLNLVGKKDLEDQVLLEKMSHQLFLVQKQKQQLKRLLIGYTMK